jgi:mannose-6-phosphate isomerase-like protein (cupin superfamily)
LSGTSTMTRTIFFSSLRVCWITLGPGQMYIVPKVVEHRPVAREEVHLLLIEPTGTPNTGDVATAALRKTA